MHYAPDRKRAVGGVVYILRRKLSQAAYMFIPPQTWIVCPVT